MKKVNSGVIQNQQHRPRSSNGGESYVPQVPINVVSHFDKPNAFGRKVRDWIHEKVDAHTILLFYISSKPDVSTYPVVNERTQACFDRNSSLGWLTSLMAHGFIERLRPKQNGVSNSSNFEDIRESRSRKWRDHPLTNPNNCKLLLHCKSVNKQKLNWVFPYLSLVHLHCSIFQTNTGWRFKVIYVFNLRNYVAVSLEKVLRQLCEKARRKARYTWNSWRWAGRKPVHKIHS